MKIGFEAKRVFRNFTGLGNYSRAVVKVLAENFKEYQYHLYTPSASADLKDNFQKRWRNITIHLPKSKIFKSIWRVSGITEDLKKDQIDLFHGLSNELPLNIKKYRIPAVVTIHDLIYLRYPHYFKYIDRKIYDYKFRKACRNADRIIAISQQTKRDLVEFFGIDPQKIDVVYQGCDPVFYAQAESSTLAAIRKKYHLPDDFLLCVGTIERRKNQLLIAKALKGLPTDTHLVLVGKATEYKKDIEEYISRYPEIRDRVHFLSNVPFEDLPLIFQSASIFVYPSRFEGFGIPVIEALRSRIPVIAATGSCLEEAGGPDTMYIHPDDETQLVSAIQKIKKDEALREKMIENGLIYAQQFSEENIARNLMNVYLKVLSNAQVKNKE